jgi:hypothetical protein
MNQDTVIIQAILEIISHNPGGVGVSKILSLLEEEGKSTSRRSLQRALTKLVSEQKIIKSGSARATVYLPFRFVKPNSKITIHARSNNYNLPLDLQSEKVLDYLNTPVSLRRPKTYYRKFLDDYIPNKTNYLDNNTITQLHGLGKTADISHPAGTYSRQIIDRLLVDLSWASSKLEGNTYTKLDTQRLINYGESPEGKDSIETQMILNHKDAINFLVDEIENIGIDKYTLMNLHGLLSFGLLLKPDDSGRIRSCDVDMGGSVYRPTAVIPLVEECFDIIITKAADINEPFEQSFFLMVHLPYLQPFIDVNKRVSRLAANIPLLKNNLCPLTFIGIPEKLYIDGYLGIYELNDYSLLKDVFVWAYERSSLEYLTVKKTLQAPDPLLVKHRKTVQDLVALIVKKRDKNYLSAISDFADRHIDEDDRKLFAKIVIDELDRLHEGVLSRYKLTISDYKEWTKSKKPSATDS